ncbi:hypothetical protein MLD38_033281 [Melastoma candidum]|uniref:Uncharacterized protein n=1 Tax=Melastoma candidum TaxID=119954 RepID=A0ACB9M8B4_9MYRT|nr:hypothetical protein MLD38_033281 [Melastoma candidum]
MEKKIRNGGDGLLSFCMAFLVIFHNLVVPVLSEQSPEDDVSFSAGSNGSPLLSRGSVLSTGGHGHRATPPSTVRNCRNLPLVYSPPPSRSSGGGYHGGGRRGGGNHHTPPSSGSRGGGTGGYYPSPPLVPTPPSSGSSGGGTGGYTYPSPPLVPTPPSRRSGGGTGGYAYPSPPLVPTPPSRSSGGGTGGYVYPSPPLVPTPPSRRSGGGPGGYSYPSPPLVPTPPSGAGGGYAYGNPPPSGAGGGGVLTPPTPVVILPPTTPIGGGITPPTPPYYPITGPFPGTCDFWRTHPAIIFGLLGWLATIGGVFGVTSLPGLPSSLNLLQALSVPRDDGISQLYREGTASLLNSMVSREFPYTTQQVKDRFVKSLHSDKAAAAQARLFKLANGGHFKPRG